MIEVKLNRGGIDDYILHKNIPKNSFVFDISNEYVLDARCKILVDSLNLLIIMNEN